MKINITLLLFLFGFGSRAQQLPLVFKEKPAGMETDTRTRVYLSPTRVLWQSDKTGKYVKDARNLLKPGNGQGELVNRDMVTLTSDARHKGAILLDFGRELHGGLQIVTGMMKKNGPVKIRVRFGESAAEAMADLGGKTNATNDHAIRDLTVEVPWLGVLDIGNTGFRFVRIDLSEADAELLLKEVRAAFIFRNIPYLGSFKSSDERLNKIWETGAYTVHLNMQQYLWDGIKRDRLVWVGDMHPEVTTISNVFGYNDVVPKSLDLVRDITPPTQWMNGISAYSMWWIIIHRDLYKFNGDLSYLRKQKDYLIQLLDVLSTKVDDKNSETLDGRFLDWPSSENKPAIHAGLQALMVIALDAGSEICGILKDNASATKYKAVAVRMRKYIPDINGSKQAAALLSLSGMMPAEKANEVIAEGGAKNFSTFYGYYMLEAMAKAGNYQGAIDIIKTYWGAMLDLGATTFWEDFNMEWIKNAGRIDELVPEGKIDIHGAYGAYCYVGFRHSLSHGWASGPTSWLSEHVLGFKVMEPGCKTVRIEPHLGDLKFAEGSFPTPYGIIKVKHTRLANGKVQSDIMAPKAIKIIRANL
ncbi:alpha-L-rhamnosidase C-terminal domain-containing protein [Pedobacter sp. JY14-1]|uniref:alpha-L-rhamnosidase-related protein n=1 Tax=Pedobacter sp. JY14-1 TaxID=3034151 RepID=UPI0023E0F235|nr:alpha-L-rhamnosidase C-terminal domain-containing protein [Pedobacter sp. JY14-1]